MCVCEKCLLTDDLLMCIILLEVNMITDLHRVNGTRVDGTRVDGTRMD